MNVRSAECQAATSALRSIFYMSTLVNEQLYETCFDESFDEYMRISGLSGDQMSDWMRVNPFVIERIEEMAYKKFQDMCQ